MNKLTEKWGYKQDNTFLLVEFTSIHKDGNEIVSEFNNRLTRLYLRISHLVCPNGEFALVIYINAFDESFNFLLSEDI